MYLHARYGWTKVNYKTPLTHNGVIDLTATPKAVIRKHAVDGWTDHMLSQDKHGEYANRANVQPCFEAHYDYFHNADSHIGRWTPTGCAPDYGTARNEDVEPHCQRNQPLPMRRHWAWNCTHHSPSTTNTPTCELEAGLCVPLISRRAKHVDNWRSLGMKASKVADELR